MLNQQCVRLGYLAQKAVLYEVTASPKPGLVDRYNSGAHRDMDFYTFMASSASLFEGFYECALAGYEFVGADLSQLLAAIRPIGIKTEQKMFEATGGINTHKGIIFSLGIISAIAGHMYGYEQHKGPIQAETICDRVKEMTKGLTQRELTNLQTKDTLTNGERLFRQFHLKGIRGEAESGFQTVREKGLVVLRQAHSDLSQIKGEALNNLLLQILLNIMTTSEDTNIVSRHNLETLEYVQNCATIFINSGGIYAPDGKERLVQMDSDFIKQNISPGGSADLLAVTLLLGMIEGINI